MVNPKISALTSVEKISGKLIFTKAPWINVTRLVCSLACTFKNDPSKPMNPLYITSNGTMSVLAMTRVTTRYLNGFTAETSMASICSVTRMEPNSAPICDPTFPAQIKPVINGANAFMIAIPINDGSHDVAPKSANAGLECFVKTIPVINAVSVINDKDLYPTL